VIAYNFSMALLNAKQNPPNETVDESAAKDVAQLISGSLIYRLYEVPHLIMTWRCLRSILKCSEILSTDTLH
jgi:hypothetical protein